MEIKTRAPQRSIHKRHSKSERRWTNHNVCGRHCHHYYNVRNIEWPAKKNKRKHDETAWMNHNKSTDTKYNENKIHDFPNTHDKRDRYNRTKLQRAVEIKYLGINVDNELNWKTQTRKMMWKLSVTTGIFGNIGKYIFRKHKNDNYTTTYSSAEWPMRYCHCAH